MSKYKAGDKIVIEIGGCESESYYAIDKLGKHWFIAGRVDGFAEPLSEYTEKLEKKNQNKQKRIEKLVDRLHRQADEITRLLAENAELKGLNSIICDVCKHDEFLKETRELARAEGQEEAWELAKKIASMKFDEAAECFTDYDRPLGMRSLMNKYSYTEAAAKVAEWERQKEEIRVGDIVRIHEGNDNDLCIICSSSDGYYNAVDEYGAVYPTLYKKMISKTGRHIDVDAWLAQIGGESNE